MLGITKFNAINAFYQENSDYNTIKNWKKRKRNFNKSLTIQNKNYLSQNNRIFSLSYEAFDETEFN